MKPRTCPISLICAFACLALVSCSTYDPVSSFATRDMELAGRATAEGWDEATYATYRAHYERGYRTQNQRGGAMNATFRLGGARSQEESITHQAYNRGAADARKDGAFKWMPAALVRRPQHFHPLHPIGRR